ncbi:MAG: hypothetical protein AAFP90_21795 [Planctomycetota bacterium]
MNIKAPKGRRSTPDDRVVTYQKNTPSISLLPRFQQVQQRGLQTLRAVVSDCGINTSPINESIEEKAFEKRCVGAK